MNKVLKIKQTQEQMVYWTSDTHLNHNKPFVYEARGHATSNEHTDFVINKINEIVRPNDILIHCGDFCLNTEEAGFNELLDKIKCQNIYMLWGNHNNPLWKVYQREVMMWAKDDAQIPIIDDHIEIYPFKYKNITFLGNYAEISVDGQYFIVCHYPMYVFNYMKDGASMICGHSHYALPFSQAENLENKILDVGWDGFARPLSMREITYILSKKSVFVAGDHHTKE